MAWLGLSQVAVGQKDVTFRNGEVQLAGTLYLPEVSGSVPAIIVVHSASGASRNYYFYDHLKEQLPKLGIAVLAYDRRGSGQSNGNFQTADFEDLADDAIAARDFLAQQDDVIDATRIGLWGVSQGGWIGPVAASRSEDFAFVIAVSGPGVTPAEQMIYSAERTLQIQGFPPHVQRQAARLRQQVDAYFRGEADRASVQAALDSARTKPWFQYAYIPGGGTLPRDVSTSKWYQEMDYNPLPVLSQVDDPMLLLFGATDRWVPVETSMQRIQAVTADHDDVIIRSFEGADHYLMIPDPTDGSSRVIAPDYLHVLEAWLTDQLKL